MPGMMRWVALYLSLIGATAAAAQAQDIATPLRFAPFTFVAADSSKTEADSATLIVPKNRLHPERGSVTIPVVRFRARAGVTGPPIVYISGGTGSGIAAARGSRYPFVQALREVGDVVTFDLRGANRSRPRIACKAGEPIPVAEAMTYAMLSGLLERNARACVMELRKADVDPAGHNIRETVDDIDALRIALGAQRIHLIGTSTGSQIGLEYLRRHGSNTGRAVLLGIQAPDQNLHSPADLERVLRTLNERNQRNAKPQEAAFDLVASVGHVLRALDSAPRVVQVRNRNTGASSLVALGKFDAQLLVAGSLGDRRAMGALPLAFAAAQKGDYSMLAQFKMQAASGGITSPFEALFDCQTGAPAARRRAMEREARTALLGNATLDFPEACAGWMTKELDASYRARVTSRVPILFISGTLDGRTPVRNAEVALQSLPNGMHLVIDGATHGDDLFVSSSAIREGVRAFLEGKKPSQLRITLP